MKWPTEEEIYKAARTFDSYTTGKMDFESGIVWLKSQLSEGGEELRWPNLIIATKNEEIQSLKQHNLKLTECLRELIFAIDQVLEEYTFGVGMPAKLESLENSITKAKSLIK